jgi:hypothetical protein
MDRKLTRPDKPKARSQPLPGLEDLAIRELEQLAANYADVRDRRMEVGREEVTLKTQAIGLMKKFGKSVYKRDGIEITLVPGEETISVKVKRTAESRPPRRTREAGVEQLRVAGARRAPAEWSTVRLVDDPAH